MAAPLNTCTTIEKRGVVRFLWAKNMEAKDIHIQEMDAIWTYDESVAVVQRKLRYKFSVYVRSVAAAEIRQEISVSEAIDPRVKP
jgi:hypothetical protein